MEGASSMETIEKGSMLEAITRWNPRKGGFRAAMFVFVMSAFENIGFVANMVTLVIYFMVVMHFDLSGSATTLTNFVGTTFLLALLGGFISDAYMTRLNTVLAFGFLEIVGYILLTIQAHYKSLQPDATCLQCKLGGSNGLMFYLSLCFMALGSGGLRGCVASLGADQFDKNHPNERKQLASFFNWLLLSITIGASFGVTFIAYISTTKNKWALAFFVSGLLALVGFNVVAVGKPFYRVRVPDSPLVRFCQVIVVAIKNRNLLVEKSSEALFENNEKEFPEEKIPHTNQFRFLDKAAMVVEGATPEPWKVCTVTQVEEVKIFIRMLPILCSTIVMNTCMAQLQTFSVQQGIVMARKLRSFAVPPSSIPVIPLLFMSLLLPLYELLLVPLARRLTGHPSGITHLQRVGVGLVLSVASMAAAALVETKRRDAFNHHQEIISLFWLSFQYCVFGVADMFTLVGLLEFFYSEAPAGMRSLSTSFTFLSLSLGNFLSSVLVHAVESATGRMAGNGQGWLHGLDLNQNRLDLFYWFLAVLSCVNFGVYLLCANWYEYRKDGADVPVDLSCREDRHLENDETDGGKENDIPVDLSCREDRHLENDETDNGKENDIASPKISEQQQKADTELPA